MEFLIENNKFKDRHKEFSKHDVDKVKKAKEWHRFLKVFPTLSEKATLSIPNPRYSCEFFKNL